ncbi:SusC/RagA family TonB-linked outer membrane protein [Epilithonimonas mollis]|uniref:TonB-linked outer membrane protein, SusC/RagA family n=1 Tax=Epilithonimonas mollis TaxID=216903 RepID=A0A1M6UIG0_9FLAO|nr:SusC/RagA family TonB-linked outer membrane protein [Epilithonimonas mollis]SHK68888.1 TonB-linked outer membrane protein, SusC/RagA family [Epilithonimonas mollis]
MKKSYSNIGSIGLVFMFTAICGNIKAQTKTVTGTVTVGGNQSPLSGVVVSQEGSDQVTLTNSKGIYQLEITGENPSIIFRHPEYEEKKIAFDGRTIVNLKLDRKEQSIEEVVVNAGYYKVRDKERTGSIARVSAKEIENQPVTNVLASAQGRMSGVAITQNSGTAGGGFDIQIRGKNSLRFDGNYPLIIVDGVPLNAQSNSLSTLSNNILSKGESSPLNSINPNDIESMEVLKDADATAIYGSRGANGVVIVTTKKGKKGKSLVEFSAITSVSRTNKLVGMANTEQYLQLRRDAYANDGITTYPVTAYDINGKWDHSRNTDWYREFIGKTFMSQQQQLAYSGGSENVQYYLGLSNLEQGSAFGHGLKYKRSGFNFSTVITSPDKKFKISPTIFYTKENNDQTDADLTRQILLAPDAPMLYQPDGSLNWEGNTFTNPLAKLENKYLNAIRSLVTNVNASYEISDHWALKLNAGYTQTQQNESRINPSSAYNPSLGYTSSISARYEGLVSKTSWIIEPQLHWNTKWNNHSFSAFLGSTFEDRKNDIVRLQASDFTSNEFIDNLSNAKVQKIVEDTNIDYRYTAFFGRFNYNYSGKYIFNLTGRRDGSSRFGPDKRFANFGAVGAAWLFSEERLFKQNLKWLSFGKLRASLGTSGSDLIGDYQYLNTYTTTSQAYDGTIGIYPSRLFNPDFSWEKTTKLEYALELGFLKDRINLSVGWFRNRSSNQLVGIPLPATTGFATIQSNFSAKVQNSGTETDLSISIVRGQHVKWRMTGNWTLPKSKLLEYDNLQSSSYSSTYEVGKSLNIKKVYELKGVNPTTGLFEFSDLNGDGKIDSNDRTKVVDIGIKYFGGIGSQVSYKNWSLDFLFQFVKQRQFNLDYSLPLLGSMSNVPTYMLDYWTPENPDARFQRPSTGANTNASRAFAQYQASDAVIVDASFIRLNNLQIGYKVPLSGTWINDLTLQVHAQNLVTFTKYKGIDPEVQGLFLPLAKTFAFSANIKF